MSNKIDLPRRSFLGTASLALAAAQFGALTSAHAQSVAKAAPLATVKPGTHSSFGTIKQVRAGVLDV